MHMLVGATMLATFLLSLERLCYWWVWNHPDAFIRAVRQSTWLSADPISALRRLFQLFKLIQITVLLGWCMGFGQTWLPLPTASWPMIVLGFMLLAAGQVLNFSVMWRLGTTGVFYGNRFGKPVEWQTGFPFSVVPHPQYLGALASVWGFMLIMRYPHPDWIILPLVSTVLYAWGSYVERE